MSDSLDALLRPWAKIGALASTTSAFWGAFNRFGVSRPVVREALSHLRSMGFIVSGKGLRQLYAKRQSSHSQESMPPNKVLRFRGTPYARFQERI
jgi:hypothetical protein